ncbi:hypothetical protein TIFTF001_023837 [Ficus carica]|uniref:Uncharacterized protein n=1 Tax=Ficus carica TaxID=3494 RepID=A0AA88AFI9_FICCA|nr:hypothetical protein TIFTF001_023837 [Ficus carica]
MRLEDKSRHSNLRDNRKPIGNSIRNSRIEKIQSGKIKLISKDPNSNSVNWKVGSQLELNLNVKELDRKPHGATNHRRLPCTAAPNPPHHPKPPPTHRDEIAPHPADTDPLFHHDPGETPTLSA